MLRKIQSWLSRLPHGEVKLFSIDTPALIEAGKEAARVVLIAVVPVLISMLERDAIDYRLLIITGAIAFLRAVDKYLHKAVNKKGLTQF